MTTAIARVNNGPVMPAKVRAMLIEREKQLIAQAQAQRDMAQEQVGFVPFAFDTAIRLAKQRIQALTAGLIPIRIAGRFFPLAALLREAQAIPPQIGAQAAIAAERLPGAEVRVYGWDKELPSAERRRRDPELTAFYGGQEYWLGYWREIETYDENNPQFFGYVAHWEEKRGRGRPRKALR